MAHNTKNLNNPCIESNTSETNIPAYKICKICNTSKPSDMFYSNKSKGAKGNCRTCHTKIAMKRQHDMKKQMIEYKGGKCCVCNYNETYAGLSFHHVDPTKKELEIARLTVRAWKNVKPELDKCVLVCVRCHTELHHSHLKESHSIIINQYIANQNT